MSASESNGSNPAHWLTAEAVYQRFEDAWQSRPFPALADFLPTEDATARRTALVELIKIDLEYRWRRGERTRIESYLSQFPELGDERTFPIELLREEARVRNAEGAAPVWAELAERFPARCEELNTWPELANSAAPTTVSPSQASPPTVAERRRVGRYELLEQLGQGGFGTVYRSWDPQLQRDVAVKVPRIEGIRQGELRTRALREAQSAAQLRHPGIVPIYEVGQENGTLFIVSAFVPGPTLLQVFRNTAPAPSQVALWVADLADAVDYAHHAGIVHRDIKPANILLDKEGRPMLTDFGLARQVLADESLTQEGDLIGTLAYMSPEQADGKAHEADPRSDVYSLGVVLYEGLCRQVPFTGGGASVLHRILDENPKPPRHFNASVTLDLETICLKALAKEPESRYPSAAEMADDLRRYLNHLPIAARRVGPLGRLARWCRRKPALAATLAAAIVVIGVVAAVSYREVLHERDRYRSEWNRAQQNLYESLIGQATAEMRGKDTGWWWRAMDRIEQAARLDVPQRDPRQLRDLAVQCMCSSDPCFRLQHTWPAHRQRVTAVAVDPQERWLASASADQTVVLRRLPDGKEEHSLEGHTAFVTNVLFHPNEDVLATASLDGTLRMWHLPDAANPAPRLIQVCELTPAGVRTVAFSSDGKRLAAGSGNGEIQLFSVNNDAQGDLHATRTATFSGHQQAVSSVSFSFDGKLLAACSSRERMIRLWDLRSGKEAAAWPTLDSPSAAVFAPASQTLAFSTIESMGIGIFDLDAQGNLPAQTRMHDDAVMQVLWHPRGLLSASMDGSLRLRNSRFALLAEAKGDFSGVAAIACAGNSPKARWVAAGYADGAVRLWALAVPQQQTAATLTNDVAFLDATRLASAHVRHEWNNEGWKGSNIWPAQVVGMTVHDDDTRMTLARADGAMEIWNLTADEPPKRLEPAPGKLACGRATKPGRCFAVGSVAGEIIGYDLGDGKKRWQIATQLGRIHALAWNEDGTSVAALGEYGFGVWQPSAPDKPRWQVSTLFRHRGAIACGSESLAVSLEDGKIGLFAIDTGNLMRTLPGHAGQTTCLAFSPDGRQLASGGGDQILRWWSVAAGQQEAVFPLTSIPAWLDYAPHGRWLLVDQLGTAVWDVAARLQVAVVTDAHDIGAAFSAEGSRAYLATSRGPVRICREVELVQAAQQAAKSGPQRLLILEAGIATGHLAIVWATAASPDGRWFATAGHDALIQLWDAKSMERVKTLRGHQGLIWNLAISPDSRWLASASGEIKIWDLIAGKLRFDLPDPARTGSLVRSVVFHPTKPWLISAATNGSVRLWDIEQGRDLGLLHSFTRPVYKLAIDPQGRWLAAACDDHQVAVWDLSALQVADGVVARPPERMLAEHKHAVWAVAFSADGRYIATGSGGGIINLWDTSNWTRLTTFYSPGQQVRSLAFSADRRFLAVACFDGLGTVIDLERVQGALQTMHIDW